LKVVIRISEQFGRGGGGRCLGPQCVEKNQYQDSRTGGRTETGFIRAGGLNNEKKSIKMVDRA